MSIPVTTISRSTKFLVTIEVIVSFAPISFLLVFGVLLVPLQLYAIVDEPLIWQGPASVVGSVLCGVVGLSTLGFVMWKLFDGHGLIAKPALICAGIAVGALPVIPIAAFGDPLGWKIVGALPLAVSAHILFLARRMLFPSWRDGLRSIAIGTGVALIPLSVIALNPFQTADNTLRNQKGLWEKAAPSGYEFTIQLSGWVEPEALSPKRVTVENGDVVAAVYISPRHSAGDPAPMEGLWTIERAFAELSAAKERGWRVSARFDEHWGFVERAFVDANEPSSSWDLEIRDFQVVQD